MSFTHSGFEFTNTMGDKFALCTCKSFFMLESDHIHLCHGMWPHLTLDEVKEMAKKWGHVKSWTDNEDNSTIHSSFIVKGLF